MTSNVKVGLLIGLSIVFVVVFIINGLSGLTNKDNNLLPIVDIEPQRLKLEQMPDPYPAVPTTEEYAQETSRQTTEEPSGEQPPITTQQDETENHPEPVEKTWPKVHVVSKGENLADIAKKFYGPKEGNRRANIKKIFEANSKLLKSPDKIFPGQKLIIPAIWASMPNKNRIDRIFPDSMFEKVESIGRRHI